MPVGAVGAVTSVYGAYNQKRSGDKAARSQEQAANQSAQAQLQAAQEANALQQYMYDQGRSDYSPYRKAGYGALSQLAGMYNIDVGDYPQDLEYSGYMSGINGPEPGSPEARQQEISANRDRYMNALWNKGNKQKLGALGYEYRGDDVNFADITDEQIAGFHEGKNRNRLQRLRAIDRDLAEMQAQGDQQMPGSTVSATDSISIPGQQGPDFSSFYESPDYKFAVEEGNKALDRSAASRGRLFSGGQLKAATRYNQGLGTQQFNNYANRLASIAGIGQTSTSGVAGLGSQYASAAGGNIMAAGRGQANALTSAGDARASGYINQGNALNSGLNNAMNLYGMYKGGYFGGGTPGFNPTGGGFSNYDMIGDTGWSGYAL